MCDVKLVKFTRPVVDDLSSGALYTIISRNLKAEAAQTVKIGGSRPPGQPPEPKISGLPALFSLLLEC